jgi:large subunit ribosomal protein L24e
VLTDCFLIYFRSRKAVRVQRAIVGASLDELRSKRQVTKKTSAATEAALKEVKDRAKTGAKKQTGAPRAAGAAVPKNQKSFK